MSSGLEPIKHQELEELVRCVAAGEPLALELLFHRTGAVIRATAHRWLRSNEDAEEVALDVFAQVWKHAHVYDPLRGGVISWLAVIARNKSLDRLRRRRRMVMALEDSADLLACDSVGPEDHLMQKQAADRLRAALSKLSPMRRRVLTLAFFDGQTHEEIAQNERLPLGSVKSHARRALIDLRDHVPWSDQPLK